MFGWFSDAPTLASRWKRTPTSSALSAWSRLMATSRSRRQSFARKTVAMPPAPRRFCIRYRSATNSPVVPTGIPRYSPVWGGAKRTGRLAEGYSANRQLRTVNFLNALNQRPGAEPAATAHRDQAHFLVRALELVQEGGDEAGAGGA